MTAQVIILADHKRRVRGSVVRFDPFWFVRLWFAFFGVKV